MNLLQLSRLSACSRYHRLNSENKIPKKTILRTSNALDYNMCTVWHLVIIGYIKINYYNDYVYNVSKLHKNNMYRVNDHRPSVIIAINYYSVTRKRADLGI